MLNNPDWSAIFAPQGKFLCEGEMMRRTNLSRTLAAIAQEGADALYHVLVFFEDIHPLIQGNRDPLQIPWFAKFAQPVAYFLIWIWRIIPSK